MFGACLPARPSPVSRPRSWLPCGLVLHVFDYRPFDRSPHCFRVRLVPLLVPRLALREVALLGSAALAHGPSFAFVDVGGRDFRVLGRLRLGWRPFEGLTASRIAQFFSISDTSRPVSSWFSLSCYLT